MPEDQASCAEPAQAILKAREALARGDLHAALDIAANMLAADPDRIDALEVKALAEAERGDVLAAEQTLRSVIAIAPERRWPYADLSRLLLKAGRHAEAQAVARAALQADPSNPDAHAILGSLFASREQWPEAAFHFERSIALAGAHQHLLTGLGQALLRRGLLTEARRALEAAVELDRTTLEPLVYLAEVEERTDRFEAALKLLDEAGRLARSQGTDVDLQRSVLLARAGRPREALALLDGRTDLLGAARLQRGRLLDSIGRHAEAWADWVEGKAELAARHNRRYPAEEVSGLVERLRTFFSSTGAGRLPPADMRADVPQPLFILGFPRSGTTLTEQILAAHSGVVAGGELPFGSELRDFAAELAGGAANFPEGLGRMNARDSGRVAALLRDFYLERAEARGLLGAGARYFTDKMPTNGLWLPLLRLAFPHSPVVHVRRHPLDTLASVMSHDMTHGFNCAYDVADAARHLALTDGLTRAYSNAGFGPTYELRYEALVADPLGEIGRLAAACGLAMEASQLSFHDRPSSPTPSYAQVREPLNDRAIGRWRNFERELRPVRAIVQGVIANGGYAG